MIVAIVMRKAVTTPIIIAIFKVSGLGTGCFWDRSKIGNVLLLVGSASTISFLSIQTDTSGFLLVLSAFC